MKRWLYAYRYVTGDPERLERVLLRRSDELLRLATGAPDVEPAGDGSFLVEVPARVAGFDAAKRVRVSVGVAEHRDLRSILPITWAGEPGRALFPRFDGALECEPHDVNRAQLTLVGSYDPPFGVLGGAIDASLLHRAAHATAQRLVDALATELERSTTGPSAERAVGPKRGPLTVRDVMTSDPLVLDESLPLRTGALILFHSEVSGAPVVASDGRLVGVLSERDLLAKEADRRFGWGRAAMAEDDRRSARTVGEVCTEPARVTAPNTRLAAATREMLDHDVSRLVVVGEGRIIGIVSRHDVLAALIREDGELLEEIRRRLDAHGLGGITAAVEWGHVTLSGTTQLRSTASTVHSIVDKVDGVFSVDEHLGWIEDDVLPRIPTPM